MHKNEHILDEFHAKYYFNFHPVSFHSKNHVYFSYLQMISSLTKLNINQLHLYLQWQFPMHKSLIQNSRKISQVRERFDYRLLRL